MRVKEYAAYDALGLAELLHHGEVTAGEVYAAAVEAITVVNAKINAVANGPWERPLEYALDGPFGGVPFVVKDLGCHPQGVPNRMGTRLSGKAMAICDRRRREVHRKFSAVRL